MLGSERLLQPVFSKKATREHEVVVQRYIDLLMRRLEESIDRNSDDGHASATTVVDLIEWLNFTTFDVIGDLGWGSSFGCLQGAKYHPWLAVVLHFKAVLFATAVKYCPWLDALLMKITPKLAMADLERALQFAHEKVQYRLARHPTRGQTSSRRSSRTTRRAPTRRCRTTRSRPTPWPSSSPAARP
jgi:Cytochrome P450